MTHPVSPPPVAVLGLCSKARALGEGPWRELDIKGLTSHVLAPVLPFTLSGWSVVVAAYDLVEQGNQEVVFVSPSGKELQLLRVSPPQRTPEPDTPARRVQSGWMVFVARLTGWGLEEAGVHRFMLRQSSGLMPVGALNVIVPDVPPLTPDRIKAYQAYPGAHAIAELAFSCQACESHFRAYTGYQRDSSLEAGGALWYQDLPERYRCACGRVTLDMSVLRRQMHVLLDPRLPRVGELSLTHLHTKRTLRNTLDRYADLLTRDESEESIQRFLAANPLFFAPFSPTRILDKAPVLNRFITDFAILDHKRELILIEIERPSTRLLKRTGGTPAPLQHAVDQVNDWLMVMEEHRAAALECMGLSKNEVATIKGVVIAGRSQHHSQDAMRRMRAVDRGRVTVLTFDDLAVGFQRAFEQLQDQEDVESSERVDGDSRDGD